MTPPGEFEPEYGGDLGRRVHFTAHGPDGPVLQYGLSMCVLVEPCVSVTVDVMRS